MLFLGVGCDYGQVKGSISELSLTCSQLQPDEMSIEAQDSSSSSLADEEKSVASAYEEAFRLIKDCTGITDVEARAHTRKFKKPA